MSNDPTNTPPQPSIVVPLTRISDSIPPQPTNLSPYIDIPWMDTLKDQASNSALSPDMPMLYRFTRADAARLVAALIERLKDDPYFSYPPSFEDFPRSVTEIRGEDYRKAKNAASWSVRDVLIAALRDLDSGNLPDAALAFLVIRSESECPNDECPGIHWHHTTYTSGDRGTTFHMGMLESLKIAMYNDSKD